VAIIPHLPPPATPTYPHLSRPSRTHLPPSLPHLGWADARRYHYAPAYTRRPPCRQIYHPHLRTAAFASHHGFLLLLFLCHLLHGYGFMYATVATGNMPFACPPTTHRKTRGWFRIARTCRCAAGTLRRTLVFGSFLMFVPFHSILYRRPATRHVTVERRV